MNRPVEEVDLDEEEDTCEKLSFGVFHFFHFFVHARISAGLCSFSLIFSTNDSVFRAEHAPLLRRAYFLSKTQDLRVRGEVKKVKSKAEPSKRHNFSQVYCPTSITCSLV